MIDLKKARADLDWTDIRPLCNEVEQLRARVAKLERALRKILKWGSYISSVDGEGSLTDALYKASALLKPNK